MSFTKKITTVTKSFLLASLCTISFANPIIYKSIDGSRTWTTLAGINDPHFINFLVIDPMTPSTVYAAVYGGGIYKSLDSGETWQKVNSGLRSLLVTSLAINPKIPSNLYVGEKSIKVDDFSDGGIYKSTDGGATWKSAGVENEPWIGTIATNPIIPTTIYAGTSHGVYTSHDDGATWIKGNGDFDVSSLAFDTTTQPASVFAGDVSYHASKIFKSINDGIDWVSANQGFKGNWACSIVTDPLNPRVLYAASCGNMQHQGNGIFKSTNGGVSWESINNGLDNLRVLTLSIDPVEPNKLYAGTETNLYKSTDGGSHWQATTLNHNAAVIAIDPKNSNVIYVTQNTGKT